MASLGEIETLLKEALGDQAETLADKTNQIVRQAFEDNLKIQGGDSVDLPKIERKVGSLWAAKT